MLFWIFIIMYISLYAYAGILGLTFLSYWFPKISEITFFKFLVNLGSYYLDFFRGKIIVFSLDLGTYLGFAVYGFILSATSLIFLVI